MHPDIQRILISEKELHKRVKDMAAEITASFSGKDLLVIGILKGSVIFLADLVRQLPRPAAFDFMKVSSYGLSTESSGSVSILCDITENISGRHILLAEDIIDTGQTLSRLIPLLRQRNPASVKVAALLDKPERRTASLSVDFTGFTIPDEFVVGYGLDYAEQYRNLPYIGVLKPSIYQRSL